MVRSAVREPRKGPLAAAVAAVIAPHPGSISCRLLYTFALLDRTLLQCYHTVNAHRRRYGDYYRDEHTCAQFVA